MFFLIFGAGKHVKVLGVGEYRSCPRCNNHTQWQKVEESTRVSLFFVPVVSWGKKSFERCGICGHEIA